ncbi:MAG: sporulation protein [Defluviitaleaceae bacterium]|nr:sporulation protein [Defluviitaleaceae bacterium]
MDAKVPESIKALFTNMENFVSTKTVVGEPVTIGDVILIPLVDVSFGMGTGLVVTGETKDGKDGGGGAVGAKMTPAAVVVIANGTVQLVNVKNQESVNKLIDMIPGVLSKFNLGSIFGKKDKPEEENTDFK